MSRGRSRHSSRIIVERERQDGRTIDLDIVMSDAEIEDVLRLAVRSSSPALVGGLKLKTKFLLPPGKGDAIDKLQLDGSFEIASAQFSEGGLQAEDERAQSQGAGGGWFKATALQPAVDAILARQLIRECGKVSHLSSGSAAIIAGGSMDSQTASFALAMILNVYLTWALSPTSTQHIFR